MSMTNPAVPSRNADALIGERVHQLMWRHQVTQTALAPILGIGQTGLSPKLRGKRGWSADELVTISQHFGVSIGYLFGEDSEEPNLRPTDYKAADSRPVIHLFTGEAVA